MVPLAKLVAIGCGVWLATFRVLAADVSGIEQQRALFKSVYADVERGDWKPVAPHEDVLRDYVLWPDLRARYLRAQLRDVEHAEVESFLDEYGMLKPARELRYQYSLHLAAEGHLGEFMQIYTRFYHGLGIAKLDCLALQANLEGGNPKRTANLGLDLWLVGRSQADECDPVFEHLRNTKALTNDHYAQRFALAIEERRFSLARYLSRPLPAEYLDEANRWLDAQRDSARFVATHRDRPDDAAGRRQLIFALEQIAYGDPLAASSHWQKISTEYAFDETQRRFIGRHIALWAARRHLPEAAALLSAVPPTNADVEVGRWQVRAKLLAKDWLAVLQHIASLPDDEQREESWRYWEATALMQSGQDEPARTRYLTLAGERSYYGFLAADALDANYALTSTELDADDAIAARLIENPALIRARELFFVGLDGRGRSEWDAAVSILTPAEKTQAAVLADQWGWHSRAIATAASVGEFDDLTIRYPTPWLEEFSKHAADAAIRDSWAYGVARSESLFMRDVRSSAGAIGVMQLMPATGKRVARQLKQRYSGLATLTEPSNNIRLGTSYLGEMFERFGENRVLATAAYNAGPHRVDEWLPETGTVDARIWIENIPFNETRRYVRRVLAADAIFHWRIHNQLRRISSELPSVGALDELQSVAGID